MAKTNPLNSLTSGDTVTLLCQGNKRIGNEPYQITVTFSHYVGFGNDQRAIFDDVDLYKSNNRWVYGSGAHYVSVVR